MEDDVAAGDERLHLGKTERLEQTAQMIHLDRVAADIDGAQECYVFRHGSASERATLSGRDTFVSLNEGNYLLDAKNRQRSQYTSRSVAALTINDLRQVNDSHSLVQLR